LQEVTNEVKMMARRSCLGFVYDCGRSIGRKCEDEIFANNEFILSNRITV